MDTDNGSMKKFQVHPSWIGENPWKARGQFASYTCRAGGIGWRIRPFAWGRFLWPNTVNLDIRTAIESRARKKRRGRRLRRSARAVRRAGIMRWGRNL